MSVRIEDKIYITPTFFVKHFFAVEDFVVLNSKGEKISGNHECSSEYKMHVKLYNEREDIKSIFHAHPKWAVVYAINHEKIPTRILPETIFMLGEIAYLPYHMPGTEEFAEAFVEDANEGKNVFVLYNHGVTTCGETIKHAFARLETLEMCCQVSKLSGLFNQQPKQIPKEEVNKFLKKLL